MMKAFEVFFFLLQFCNGGFLIWAVLKLLLWMSEKADQLKQSIFEVIWTNFIQEYKTSLFLLGRHRAKFKHFSYYEFWEKNIKIFYWFSICLITCHVPILMKTLPQKSFPWLWLLSFSNYRRTTIHVYVFVLFEQCVNAGIRFSGGDEYSLPQTICSCPFIIES